jgi:hypothetical protein
MISTCFCPACKRTVRKLKVIEQKLGRIWNSLENKENLSKLQVEQMLLAVTLFETKFYGLDRSEKVMSRDDHDGFVLQFDQLRQQLYDFIALMDHNCFNC